MCLFPYAGLPGEAGGNLSAYAAVPDYHTVVGDILKNAAARLKTAFPSNTFAVFCDSSPIPEVAAAVLAGLGVRGRNGLLIHKKYGSFVFIGEIVTDLSLETADAAERQCENCGKCEQSCPAGALRDGKLDASLCLSAVTQKKGALTVRETEMLRQQGCVWGCDVCQNICPHNRSLPPTPVAAFREGRRSTLSKDEAERADFEKTHADRAYLWRGRAVLLRNLGITGGKRED